MSNIKLEFACFYDITDYAKKSNGIMFNHCEKVFLCEDTNDFWLVRILMDLNEDYEEEEGTILLERNYIPKDYKYQSISSLEQLNEVLEKDDGSNFDSYEFVNADMDEVKEFLDGGYGLRTLKTN